MRVTADTNVLLRAIIADDARQSAIAQQALAEADGVALPVTALCEFAWVARRHYGLPRAEIAAAIRVLVSTENAAFDRGAVDAGLRLLDAGGDFADGAIAHDGARLGGDVFVSFDRQAVALVGQAGRAQLLG